jgi:hypothetical protein
MRRRSQEEEEKIKQNKALFCDRRRRITES